MLNVPVAVTRAGERWGRSPCFVKFGNFLPLCELFTLLPSVKPIALLKSIVVLEGGLEESGVYILYNCRHKVQGCTNLKVSGSMDPFQVLLGQGKCTTSLSIHSFLKCRFIVVIINIKLLTKQKATDFNDLYHPNF